MLPLRNKLASNRKHIRCQWGTDKAMPLSDTLSRFVLVLGFLGVLAYFGIQSGSADIRI